MKIVFIALISLLGFQASALPEATFFACEKVVGTRASGTLTQAIVTEKLGTVTLHVENCTGVLNWGCGNGMANLVNETFLVDGSSRTGFVGTGVSLVPNASGFVLTTPDFTQTFDVGNCN